MKTLLIAALVALLSFNAVAADNEVSANYMLDVEGVTVADLSQLVFYDIVRKPYVMDPSVVSDTRKVSMSLRGAAGDAFYKQFKNYLATLGFSSTEKDGVFFVAPTPEYRPPSLPREVYVYQPKYRTVSYLVSTLRGLFTGQFSTQNGVGDGAPAEATTTSSSSALAFQNTNADRLVFLGTVEERQRLKGLLPKVDVPEGDVIISAAVYQVQTGHADGSAVSLAFKVLGTGLTASFAPASLAAFTSSFALSKVDLSAAVKILNSDTRFHEISTPYVRAKSGTKATFNSGSQVPVLASSTVSNSGTVTQSVQYKDSGVIFTVTPVVRGRIIDLEVSQELSSFTNTTTGVNTSPTLNKRALASSLSLADGDTIVIGGLVVDQSSASVEGLPFLPSFMDSSSEDKSRSEVLLVLQVSRVEKDD